MIKSFTVQVVFCFAIPEPYLLTLAKTDYPSISEFSGRSRVGSGCSLEPLSLRPNHFIFMGIFN